MIVYDEVWGFTPKSSMLMGFSFINHPFWGTTIYGNCRMAQKRYQVQLNPEVTIVSPAQKMDSCDIWWQATKNSLTHDDFRLYQQTLKKQ